ncbi:MAG: hypothetical protein A3I05_01270 [Deltaproteobacteria bacterium RIFCSPLOWO2_02_FULL_44_10]|nr:MAG: hypothetical protein A3C46_00780 [Deltaproteobacteria bacterium RIFCSPHIGHO2_02_FULL_44_16]OGQ46947.1 MAG: hypothetical protein A3I05_01270 [Deltaproteobacteria bacterium RIFCSPLOWO2_02_FULL_44_10]
MDFFKNPQKLKQLLEMSEELPLAVQNYPSRGQTSIQKLYQTKYGKLFLKKVSDRNHQECRINVKSGTLAERESWAHQLASALGLNTPRMMLLDSLTTVQYWLDIPDAHHFITDQGPLTFDSQNVFECACFDWLTGQIDRHDANYLYDFVHQKIILIDSAHAFLEWDGSLPHYLQIFEASSLGAVSEKQYVPFLDKIGTVISKLQELVPLRSIAEQDALHRRAHRLLNIKSIFDVIKFYRKSL